MTGSWRTCRCRRIRISTSSRGSISTYTVLSKRVLTELVRGGHVNGWDDPRMPTLAGLRRRGVPPEAIRDFVKRIGVAKANSVVDMAMLEFSIREHLNKTAERRMAVLRPLKVVIENYPEGQSEELEAANHPDNPAAGHAHASASAANFTSSATISWRIRRRSSSGCRPGREVRLRYAYFITCREVKKDAAGEVVELRCTYDPATKGGNAPDGRKVKATHALGVGAAIHCPPRCGCTIRCSPSPIRTPAISPPTSIQIRSKCSPTRALNPRSPGGNSGDAVQFERLGYFCPDKDSARRSRCSTAPSACGTATQRPPEADLPVRRASVAPIDDRRPKASRSVRPRWPVAPSASAAIRVAALRPARGAGARPPRAPDRGLTASRR